MSIRDELKRQISIRGTNSPFGKVAFDALAEIEYLDATVSKHKEIKEGSEKFMDSTTLLDLAIQALEKLHESLILNDNDEQDATIPAFVVRDLVDTHATLIYERKRLAINNPSVLVRTNPIQHAKQELPDTHGKVFNSDEQVKKEAISSSDWIPLKSDDSSMRLTVTKTDFLKLQGHEVVGFVLRKDGDRIAISSEAAVRWLTGPEYWELMHPSPHVDKSVNDELLDDIERKKSRSDRIAAIVDCAAKQEKRDDL